MILICLETSQINQKYNFELARKQSNNNKNRNNSDYILNGHKNQNNYINKLSAEYIRESLRSEAIGIETSALSINSASMEE